MAFFKLKNSPASAGLMLTQLKWFFEFIFLCQVQIVKRRREFV